MPQPWQPGDPIPPPPDSDSASAGGPQVWSRDSAIPPPPDEKAGIIAGAQNPPKQGLVSSYWAQVNPLEQARGIREMTTPRSSDDVVGIAGLGPLRTAYEAGSNQVKSGAEDLQAGNTTRGIRKIVTGIVPFVGPSLNRAGEQVEQGDYLGALGTTLGVGTNLFGPQLLKASGIGAGIRSGIQNAANRVYRIGAPGMTPELAQFGTTRGFPFTDEAVSDTGIVSRVKNQAGQAIGGPIRSAPQNRTISPGPVVQGLQDLKTKYLKSEAPAIDLEQQKFLDELRSSPNSAVPNMTPEEALDLKVKYQNRVERERATAFNRGLTENSPEIASARVIPSELGDQLVAQFPEIAGPNKVYGLSSEIKPLIAHIADLASRRNLLPSLTTIGSGVAAGFATGQPMVGTGAGIAAELMRNPAIRSRIAITLSRAARVPFPEAIARVDGYLNAAVRASGSDENPATPIAP